MHGKIWLQLLSKKVVTFSLTFLIKVVETGVNMRIRAFSEEKISL